MKKSLVIIISLIITVLNINSYGDLSESQIEKAKLSIEHKSNVKIDNSVKKGLSLDFLKVIYIVELMCFSEIGRKSLVQPLNT